MTAPGYRLGRCEVTNKAQYTTRRIAKRVAKQFNDDSRPFRCGHCGLIHLGHLKQLTRAEHRDYHAGALGGPRTPDQTITQHGGAGAMNASQRGHYAPLNTNQGEA